MEYLEAQKKSMEVEWEIGFCNQGESCWCRTIKPKDPVLYQDGEEESEYWIVNPGSIGKEITEHIVRVHNESLRNK